MFRVSSTAVNYRRTGPDVVVVVVGVLVLSKDDGVVATAAAVWNCCQPSPAAAVVVETSTLDVLLCNVVTPPPETFRVSALLLQRVHGKSRSSTGYIYFLAATHLARAAYWLY